MMMADTITETRPDIGSLAGTLEAFELENMLDHDLSCNMWFMGCGQPVTWRWLCVHCHQQVVFSCQEHHDLVLACIEQDDFGCRRCSHHLSIADGLACFTAV